MLTNNQLLLFCEDFYVLEKSSWKDIAKGHLKCSEVLNGVNSFSVNILNLNSFLINQYYKTIKRCN